MSGVIRTADVLIQTEASRKHRGVSPGVRDDAYYRLETLLRVAQVVGEGMVLRLRKSKMNVVYMYVKAYKYRVHHIRWSNWIFSRRSGSD